MGERSAKRKEITGQSATALTVADIKELVGLMKENEIAEINIEQDDSKIRIVSNSAPCVQALTQVPQMISMQSGSVGLAQMQAPAQQTQVMSEAAPAAPAAPAANTTTVFSPMVGTFYRAPAPDAPPFIEVGDMVKADSTLCIVEAMKLMNELKAETSGRVQKILVENGMPVEYNQPLFLIEHV